MLIESLILEKGRMFCLRKNFWTRSWPRFHFNTAEHAEIILHVKIRTSVRRCLLDNRIAFSIFLLFWILSAELLSNLPACRIYPKIIKQIAPNCERNYLILSIWILKTVHSRQPESFGFDVLAWYWIVHSCND